MSSASDTNAPVLDPSARRLPNDWDRSGLPAWSYFSAEMLEAEKDLLFRRHWQLICHQNDLPNPGDYLTCDFVGERALVVRGQDGVLRAFHNLCRHRGSRVVGKSRGNCKSAIVCPFHGWVYNLDGTLRGAAQPASLPGLDPTKFGLKPVEMDIWQGFVFVRMQPGPQRRISEILARFDDEVAQYRMEELAPTSKGFWQSEAEVNWKCVRDVDNEGYHVPMAHPGLDDLFGQNYFDEPFQDGASRSFSRFREAEGRLWSVRQYKKILKPRVPLDPEHEKAWLYIGVFPNCVFGFYPDQVKFYQEFPVEIGKTVQRGADYGNPDESRTLRASRYLSDRIDRLTGEEDEELVRWVWEAAFSSGYEGVHLSDLEYTVRTYHDTLRTHFPVLEGPEPAPGTLAGTNAAMIARRAAE